MKDETSASNGVIDEQIIGVIDEPNPKGGIDTLKIKKHADALTKFIQHTATPLTIGIQGEWGSGKTSLLNAIYHSLENDGQYKQIWINSWEHSLLTTPGEALLKIINEIIQEMLASDSKIKNNTDITKIASNVFKGALRIGASAVGGSEAVKVTSELLGENANSIKELRKQLNDLAEAIRDSDSNKDESGNSANYKKIIVYVDDLDRIEPKDAVQILELLKNIFSVPHCVFVLAIDYQVVVKGLKDKFGERTEENEWEFRAFFDKIIQLPFMMPMSQYSIGEYVGDLLKQIDFIDNEEQDIDAIDLITSNTIGGNPRSLKRLVNSLALIKIFSGIDVAEVQEDKKDEALEDTKDLLLFSLVCLQIAYPKIYDLLIEKPDFTTWNSDFALKITQGKEKENEEQFNNEFNLATTALPGTDFDEDWEKTLFKICYPNPRYKAKAVEISRFFSYIKDDLLKGYKNEQLKELITEVIDATAVTSISSTDDVKPREFKPGQKVIYTDPQEGLNEYFIKNRYDGNKYQEIRDLVSYINDDIKKQYKGKGYWFQYSKSMGASFYCVKDNKKSKMGGINIYAGGQHAALLLYRDPKNKWKKPYINDTILAKNYCAVTNFRCVEWYKLIIPSKTEYEKEKGKIYKLIDLSESAYHLSKEKKKMYTLPFKDGSAYNPKTDKWPNKRFQQYVGDDWIFNV